MGTFLVYMLKTAICLVVFYIFFKAFLSRDTFFKFNRFVLLGGTFCCLLLPAIRLEVSGGAQLICRRMGELEKMLLAMEKTESSDYAAPLEALSPGPGGKEMLTLPPEYRNGVFITEDATVSEKTNILPSVLCLFYLTGVLGGGLRLGRAYFRMLKLLRTGRKEKWGRYILVISGKSVSPFCWGKYIVIDKEDYLHASREILAHEKIHAGRKHTWDLGYINLLLIFQWFNPAVWLLKKELQEIHEYEADNGVINQGIDATQYQLLLVKKAVGSRLYSIANSFDHSKLKNRITMMLKEKSNRWARLKVLSFLPLAALFLLAFARPEERISVSPDVDKVTQNPENPVNPSLKNQEKPAVSPMITLKMKVLKKENGKVDTLLISQGLNSEQAVDESVEYIRNGYGLCKDIVSAVIGYSRNYPEQTAQKYVKRLDDALKARNVTKISYEVYMNKEDKKPAAKEGSVQGVPGKAVSF